MNFYDLLKARAETFADKIFLRVDNETFTYKNFLAAVDKVSEKFKTSRRGDELKNFDDCGAKTVWALLKSSGGKFFSQAVNFFVTQKNSPSNVFTVTTSGSTGEPKILQRTFESWADFFPTQNRIFRVDETTKLFIHGSLNFTGNLNAFLATMDAGGTIVTTEKFFPRRWLELVRDVIAIYLVPTKLVLLATGAPLENIRSIFTGSQVLTEAQSLSLLKKFPAAEIFLYYGASELSFVTYKKISAENAGDVQNLGRPFDDVKIFIRNGLIYVDTPFHINGVENPCTVGDAGFFDTNGDLIFLGRGDDFINRGGVKIFASAVENKLLALEGVTAAAVVKIPDETRGENFLAFIVGNVDRKIIRQALSPAESPREIIFVAELPLNSSGKVDKKLLRLCDFSR